MSLKSKGGRTHGWRNEVGAELSAESGRRDGATARGERDQEGVAAGVADIAVVGNRAYGIEISHQSSHSLPDKHALQIGKHPFQRFGITFLNDDDFSGHVDGDGQNRGSGGGNDGGNGDGPPPVGYDGYRSGSDTETEPVYDAKGDPELRATRKPTFDDMRDNGVDVDGQNYTLHPHAYNSLFKSGRKDVMPDDIIDALKTEPSPAKPGSVKYINPETGTKVYVNPDSKAIVGVWPAKFK